MSLNSPAVKITDLAIGSSSRCKNHVQFWTLMSKNGRAWLNWAHSGRTRPHWRARSIGLKQALHVNYCLARAFGFAFASIQWTHEETWDLQQPAMHLASNKISSDRNIERAIWLSIPKKYGGSNAS